MDKLDEETEKKILKLNNEYFNDLLETSCVFLKLNNLKVIDKITIDILLNGSICHAFSNISYLLHHTNKNVKKELFKEIKELIKVYIDKIEKEIGEFND